MRTLFSRQDIKLVIVAGVCLTAGAVAPATAALVKADFATNADKVDNKHAVSGSASIANRRTKLVATLKSGHLPNNIIRKAPNADKLDGKDSTAFAAAGHDHDSTYVKVGQSLTVPADTRFAVMYPLTGGTVGWMAIRGDASVRDQSDVNATVTRVGVGRYCIKAPNSREGATGVLQNSGGETGGVIRVSMGIGSFCNGVTGTNITVETFRSP